MKKILLSFLTVFITLGLSAQNINISTTSTTINCTTGGTLFDSGGAGGSYADNESFVFTVCPGSPGFGVFANMNLMDISDGDILNIYNGDDVSAPIFPDLPLDENTIYAIGAQFQATVTNVTGCLTFEFISNGDGDNGSFEFDLICSARCQSFNSSIVSSTPDTTFTPTDIYIDVCLGDTVFVMGGATYPDNNVEYAQSDATSTFEWYWDLSTALVETGINQSHYYDTPGGYIARMIAYDINGCRNFQDQVFKVRVAPEPQFVDLTDTVMCLGDSETITGLPQGTIINGQIVQGDTVYFVPPFYSGDSTFLPDGNGAVYNSPAQLTGFDLGATIEDCGDILEICVNMEHSFLGDLNIELVCPNGQSVTLKAYPGGGSTYLGNPYDGTDQSLGAGGGLQYCFSDVSTSGLLVNGPTQAATNTAGNAVIPGTYQPVDPFTDLIGCPINGLWQLQIQDNLTIDDGYIFNWSLDIAPCMYPEVDSFVMLYDLGYWDPNPTITGIVGDSNTIVIEPTVGGLNTYTYTTQNQFGCVYTNDYDIFTEEFTVEASPADTTVCAGDPVSMSAVATGDPGPFTYSWSPPTDLNNSNIQSPTSTLSGGGITYVAAVTSSNNCTFYDTATVNSAASFQFDAYGDTTICIGDSVQLFTTGGALAYLWTPNNGSISDTSAANPIVTPLATTTYNVQGDSTGCSQFRNITVAVSNIGATLIPPTNPACGQSNGSILVFGNGGAGPLTYSNDGGLTTQNNGIFTNLGAGVFHIVISDGFGCDYLDTITLVGGDPLVIDTVILVDPACGVIGSVEAILTDPALSVTYTLDVGPVSQDSSLFSGLNGGTFTISIDDGVCPAIDTTVALVGGSAVVLSVDSTSNVTCFNAADGEIYLGATGGSAYNYSIDGVNYDTVGFYNNLDTGTYSVYVESAGCIDSSFVTISQPDSLVFSSVIDSILCFGNTADITISATGGTMPYSYSIDGAPTFSSVNNYNVSGGNYTLQVMDSNNCLSVIELDTIDEPAQMVLSLDSVIDAHCGLADGAIYLGIAGGVGPYSYTLDGGATTQDSVSFINVFANNYLVEVTDDNTCTDTLTVVVQDDATLTISVAAFDSVSCFGVADATVQVSASGGTAPYQYSADGGLTYQLDSVFSNLAGGSHTFIVRDTATCIESVTFTVFEPSQLAYSYTVNNLSCDESGDGEVTITLTDGTPPYAYALDDYFSPQLTGDFSNLDAGTHTGYVIDANGCQDTITAINLTQPDTFVITNVAKQNINCNGDNNGVFTISTSGGTSGFQYNLNGGTNQSSNVFNSLAGGVYTINATDANGCPASAIDSIFEPTAIVFVQDSQQNVTCFNGNDGYLAFSATGGTGAYTYSNNNGASFQTSNVFDLLTAGTYNVKVKDANGCEESLTVTIIQTSQIQLTTSSTAVSCAGSIDGIVTINSVSGGNPPYSAIINSNAAVSFVGTYSLGNLEGGVNHSVQIVDSEGCTSAVQNVFVTQPDSLILVQQNLNDVSCSGSGDGSVSFIAQDGTPTYTFTLDVNGNILTQSGSNSASFDNLNGGQYAATLTDANGCSDNLTVSIYEPNALIIDSVQILSEITCFGYDDGALVVHASGGSQFASPADSYIYSWDPSGETDHKASALGSGVHEVTVTDANGCSVSASQTIATVDPVIANINPDSAFMSMGDTLQLGVNVLNAIGNNLDYSWSPTNGLSCTDCANPTVTIYNDIAYSVVVTDENGCTNYNYTEIYIGIDASLFFFIPNGFTPNGDGINDVFEVYGQDVKTVDMAVFNRWGEKIFEGKNQFEPWDGTFNGVLQGSGVYTYSIDVTFLNDKKIEKKGSISLVR